MTSQVASCLKLIELLVFGFDFSLTSRIDTGQSKCVLGLLIVEVFEGFCILSKYFGDNWLNSLLQECLHINFSEPLMLENLISTAFVADSLPLILF